MSLSHLLLAGSVELTGFVVAFIWAGYGEKDTLRSLPWTRLLLPFSQMALFVLTALMAAHSAYAVNVVATVMLVGGVCLGADLFLLKTSVSVERTQQEDAYEVYVEEQVQRMRDGLSKLDGERDSIAHFKEEVVAGLVDTRDMIRAHESATAVERHLSDVAGILDDTARIVCAHPALNALLQIKNRRCEELGISFLVAVDVAQGIGVSSTDLCGIFFNLLDNAINGCAGLAAGRRFVHVKARVERGFLVAKVINSYVVEETPREKQAARQPQTPQTSEDPIRFLEEPPSDPREDFGLKLGIEHIEEPERLMREHGWGLQIVKSIVERHGGMFSTESRDGIFEAAVTIPVA